MRMPRFARADQTGPADAEDGRQRPGWRLDWSLYLKQIGKPVTATFKTARLLPLTLATLMLPSLFPASAQAQSGEDTALAQCLALAGAPDNTLPASEDTLAALRAAAPFCDQAIAEGTADARVHFLMGVLKQYDGALALAMDHFRTAAWMGLAEEGVQAPMPVASEEGAKPVPEMAESQDENAPEEAAQVIVDETDDAQTAVAVAEPATAPAATPEPVPTPEPVATPEPTATEDAGQSIAVQEESQETGSEMLSPVEKCATLAGPPDSGVPVSPAALERSLDALRMARPFCEQAIADDTASAETYFQLAVLLQNEGKHETALKHFRTAADMGLAAAYAKLGDYSLFGIGPVKPDVDDAVAAYRTASENGDLAATTTLAFLYRLGRGVPRDPAQMMTLMTKAADGGYQFAQYRLAQTYLTGDGIAGGSDEALGVPNPELGAKYLELAAHQGNSKAILELAQLYADDSAGVAANPEAYALWTQKAAETGDPAAIGALGLLYETGRGVERDPARAAELYVQALETGKVALRDLRKGAARRAPPWDDATAMAFQQILQERGLYDGAIDGIIGPMSARAAAGLAP
ncbi:MAG TPA: sel1 repeat family protein [Aliiroseovarius sp.]|nr:sel1 repeat family protein [Aliiroseovarius sp.]